MAKITPSALIAAIQGKWQGSCFQMWKGIITVRRNPIPRFRNKETRYKYKGAVSTLSACHYKLSAAQKVGWSAYAALLPTAMTGFNAFMSRNCVLFLSGHPTLCIYFNAPACYSPPLGPAPIGLCYYPISNTYCLFWTSPCSSEVFVQGRYALQVGYSNQKSPSWRNFNTVVSTALKMDFNASQFPVDTMIRFTALSINKNGETSLQAEAKPPPPMPPDLYVYEPNGSERWYVGSKHMIYWRSITIDNIKIDYSINNGVDWIEISPSVAGSAGQYLWAVPDVSSAQCLVKISDASNPSNNDTSNAVFRILTTPTIDVTAPDGGEEWSVGSKYNITWDQTDCTNVKIRFSIDGGDQYQTIIESTPAAAGSYEWTIPDHESAQCYVKVLCAEDLSISNSSYNPFSIIAAALPEGCTAWWLFKTAGYDAGNTRFTDQTGNGHHATNVNGSVGANYTTMNGTSAHLTMADWFELSADRKHLSVFMWVNGPSNTGGIFEHWYVSGWGVAWEIHYIADIIWFLITNDHTASTLKQWRYVNTLLDSTPHSVGFTFDNNVFKIFVDGLSVEPTFKDEDDNFTQIYDALQPFEIAKRPSAGGGNQYLETKLYKGYIYNKTLTEAEMLDLHNLGT